MRWLGQFSDGGDVSGLNGLQGSFSFLQGWFSSLELPLCNRFISLLGEREDV